MPIIVYGGWWVTACEEGHVCKIEGLNEETANSRPLYCSICGKVLARPPVIYDRDRAIEFLNSLEGE